MIRNLEKVSFDGNEFFKYWFGKTYYISKDGKMINTNWHNSGKIGYMAQNEEKNGYLRFSLWFNGKQYKPLVHNAVAQTFIPNPYNLPEVGHLDCNPSNNSVENLYWCTHQENMNNPITRERCGKALLNRPDQSITVIQLSKDGMFIAEFQSIAEANRLTGVKNSGICNCCQGKLKTSGGFVWAYKNEWGLPDCSPQHQKAS